jgi:ABC-type nitrate/sulfonate/bicarbonate transport system substrate-binding protein
VLDGEHAATLTIEPFTSLALARGCRLLGTSAALGPYQGGVFAARRGWAETVPDAPAGFIRGYLRGLAWTLEPGNRPEAAALLARRMPAIPAERLESVLDGLLSPERGLSPQGRVDLDGIRGVLELRRRWGPPGAELGTPEDYLDLRWYGMV